VQIGNATISSVLLLLVIVRALPLRVGGCSCAPSVAKIFL
jgi:hypothetical protein